MKLTGDRGCQEKYENIYKREWRNRNFWDTSQQLM